MATKGINAKRLLKLADFLDELPRSHFDFGTVGYRCEATKKNECGTVGCAMGWTPKAFPRLVGQDYGHTRDDGRLYLRLIDKKTGDMESYDEIAARLFGFTRGEGYYLFTPDEPCPVTDNYLSDEATPKQVAKRIRAFVRGKLKQEKMEAALA